MDSIKKNSEMEKFLDMIDLVEICIERPFGRSKNEARQKDRATISFLKK